MFARRCKRSAEGCFFGGLEWVVCFLGSVGDDHVTTLESFVAASLARDNERLKFEFEQLQRYIYCRRSERHVEDSSQLNPSADEEREDIATSASDVEKEEITYRRRKPRR